MIMKGLKTILSLALMLSVGLLMGQKQVSNETKNEISVKKTLDASMPVKNTNETTTDTIGWTPGSIPEFGYPNSGLHIYGLTSGGYVGGVNGSDIDYWAQCYVLEESVSAIGILAWIGIKDNISEDNNSVLTASLLPTNEDEAITGFDDQGNATSYGPGPDYYSGNILASSSVNINDLDTTSYADPSLWQYFPFTNPVYISSDFCIVADFKSLRLNSDTAALVWDEFGNGLGLGYSQYCKDPTEYYWVACNCGLTFSGGQGLDANMSLFLIVEKGSDVNSNSYFQGMQLTFPNLTSDPELIVQFALQNASNTSIDIISVNGQLVRSIDLGMKEAGSHHTTIDISNLQSGMYFVSLNSQGSRLIKKLVIE